MERKEFIVILVITFLVIVFWAVSDLVFHTNPSIPPDPKIDALLEPISEDFDTQTIQKIENNVPAEANLPVIEEPVSEAPPIVLPDIGTLESVSSTPSIPDEILAPTPIAEATDAALLTP